MDLKTEDDWWKLLEINQEKIINLVRSYHPGSRLVTKKEMPITASAAEAVRQSLLFEQLREEGFEPNPVGLLLESIKSKNAKAIIDILNDTWMGLPESSYVRELPGFFALCDLCSEGYLVYEE